MNGLLVPSEVYTRKYRRLATLQRFLHRERGLKVLSDCHSRLHPLGSGVVDVVTTIGDEVLTLFSLSLKVWNTILNNADLLLAFDGAIRGSSLSSVVGKVRAVLVDAAKSRRGCYEGLKTIVLLGCDPLYNALSSTSGVIVTNWRPKGLVSHLSSNSSKDSWVIPGGLSCPVCHDTGMYFLEQKLDALISKAHYCKLAPVLLTFTIQHAVGDPLPVLFNVFKGNGKGAFERFRRSAAYKALVGCGSTFDGKPYLPYIAVTEVTLNIDYKGFERRVKASSLFATPDDREAWNELCSDYLDEYGCSAFVSPHLHYHALFFIRRESLTTYKSLISSLKEAWASAVTAATEHYLGRTPDRAAVLARGLDCGVRPCNSAVYLCKRDGKSKSEVWDGAKELTRSAAKKHGNVDPFALLDYPSPLNEAIFADYAAACVGKQCCSHNRDFDAFFEAAVGAETARREAAAVAVERYHEEQAANVGSILSPSSAVGISPKVNLPADFRPILAESSIFSGLVNLKIKQLTVPLGAAPWYISSERFYMALPTAYFP